MLQKALKDAALKKKKKILSTKRERTNARDKCNHCSIGHYAKTAPAHGASSGYTKLAEMADTLTDQKQTSTHPCNNDKNDKRKKKV